ncbi:MAG TPA: hypothetical protein VIH42_10770 [Thermoguttaceae bacterium]
MSQNIWGIVHQGKIETAEPIVFPDGAKVLVTLVTDEEADFWTTASAKSLKAVWDNPEDDVYAQLLEK